MVLSSCWSLVSPLHLWPLWHSELQFRTEHFSLATPLRMLVLHFMHLLAGISVRCGACCWEVALPGRCVGQVHRSFL